MTWSHGTSNKTRRATDECLLCDVGDNNIAFAALRTRGVVDCVSDVYVSARSALTWKKKREKVTLVNSETLPRDCTLINGKDAWALINNFAFVVILSHVVVGTVTVPSCGFRTRALALLNLVWWCN